MAHIFLELCALCMTLRPDFGDAKGAKEAQRTQRPSSREGLSGSLRKEVIGYSKELNGCYLYVKLRFIPKEFGEFIVHFEAVIKGK